MMRRNLTMYMYIKQKNKREVIVPLNYKIIEEYENKSFIMTFFIFIMDLCVKLYFVIQGES